MSTRPTQGNPNGFRGLGIQRDAILTSSQTTSQRNQLPFIDSTNPPPPTWPGRGGGIAYDVSNRIPYYSDGFSWIPIGSFGLNGGVVTSFSFIKDGDQNITPNTETTVFNWGIGGSPAYHTIPQWNLSTGMYTASTRVILTLLINMAWKEGISNLGDRITRVQIWDPVGMSWSTVKEIVTQADPSVAVSTTQEGQTHLFLQKGQQVRIVVWHNAPIPISIKSGIQNSFSGLQVIV